MLDFTKAIERASPFFSFVIGLGISVLLFHRDYATYRVLGVPLDDVNSKTVKVDGKCYKYRVEDATCEIVSPS
jgi:hypothetical protein|uniref:Uncharacterized protein n=1 Tax=viral metagenome TaxID=1070528 RepID=A0A6C0F354_9ZZZZ